MTDIYQLHAQTFRHVAAYVITDDKGERVATVAFKYAESGLRTTCYLHVIGFPMARGYASGGGYDKASAAAHVAANRVVYQGGLDASEQVRFDMVRRLVGAIKDEGRSWDGDLRAAGFNVLQAV